MANVYICGAETLTPPIAGDLTPNTLRWLNVAEFLALDLAALFRTNFVTNLACDPSSVLLNFVTGVWANVIPVSPNAITHPNIVVTQVVPANAITVFGANLIYNLNGGAAPNAIQLSAIATLQAQALAASVLWRDAASIGLIPPGFPAAVGFNNWFQPLSSAPLRPGLASAQQSMPSNPMVIT